MKKLLFFFLASILLFTLSAHAQSAPDVSLSTIPADPQPGESVRVDVQSYGTNIDLANITWRYNGTIVDAGVGRKSVTITAPKAGATGTVSVTVNGGDFSNASAALVLRPGSIDLLWEAVDSYTPPFYKGKALPAVNTTLRATAIPSASVPNALSYTWSQNGTVVGASSGYQKTSYTFKNSELNPNENIGVQATSGAFTGTANTTITPGNTSMVVYQKDEGFIDYANGTSSSITTNQPGLVLRLEPFFFSIPRSIAQDLKFSVTQNDVDVTNDTPQNELYLSAPGEKGQSLFSIAIRTVSYSLQQLSRQFSITFN